MAQPACAALTIDAPGWEIVWPGQANATASTLFSPGDATGDGVDDVLLFYPAKFDWNDPNFDFRNSFDLYGGSSQGLNASRLSNSPGTQDLYSYDQSALRTPKDWDFNGDGLADLALSEFSFSPIPEDYSSQMVIWFGSAQGFPAAPGCSKQMAGSIMDTFSIAGWKAVGDINGDGMDDIVAIRPPGWDMNGSQLTTHSVRLVYGSSSCTNETFRAPTLTIESEDGGTIVPLGSADFNNDGFDDLVTDETSYSPTGTLSHRLRVYPGAASNLSAPGTSFELVNAGPLQFFLGPDLNDDGYEDLVVGAGGTSLLGGENFALAYYRGSASGLVTSAQQGSQLQGAGYASAVASLGDFNGDGLQDLVLERSNITGDADVIRVEVFLGNAGSFDLPAEWSSTVRVTGVDASFSSTVDARGDVDGDGLADVLVLAGANLYGGGPRPGGQNESEFAQSAILIFYGRQIVQFLSGVGPVGFDRGVAYPTYEYGFDVTARAASASAFDRVAVVTTVGNFSYYPASNSFAFEPNTSLAPGEFARIHPSSSAAFDNATQQWDIRMRFEFTWHFPSESQVPYRLVVSGPSVPPVVPSAPAGSFRVERDIEFGGTLSLINEGSGASLAPYDWVAGETYLRLNGLVAHFEGAPGVAVPPAEFSWMAVLGGAVQTQAPGAALLNLSFQAGSSSNTSAHVGVTITGIPNLEVRIPTATFPFRIDADAPSFGAALPANDSWVSTHEVTIAVQVIDAHTGVDPARVEFQVSTTGPGGFGAWQAGSIDGSNMTLASVVASASFLDGDQNYFRFRVYDAVGNGPALSDPFQVHVDTLHVVFSDATPASNQWQRSSSVVAAVTVRDLGASGVVLSSVAYRVSNNGLFDFGPWTPITGLSGDTEVRAQASVAIQEGDQNFIQWRAEDIVGTGLTVSPSYRIIADSTAPSFGEVTPSGDERRTSSQLEAQVNVTDGGPEGRARSGVVASTVEFSFHPSGGNESEWTAQGLTITQGADGNWSVRVALELAEGPGNEVRFRASDFAGNGPAQSVGVSFHLNRGPSITLSTNATNHTVYVGSNITLTAAVSDPDGDAVEFVWYDGSTVIGQNNSAEVDLALPLGNWTFVVVARDSFGVERSQNITVHILRVPPAPPPPPPPPPPVVPRAAEGDALPWLLLVIVGGAATVYLVKRQRRRPGGETGGPL